MDDADRNEDPGWGFWLTEVDSEDLPEELTPDVLFNLLQNSRRRRALEILAEEGVMKLVDLAERIAAAENGVPISEISAKQRKRVYVSLYQTHLTKLEDVDLVEFDRDQGVVQASDELLDLKEQQEPETEGRPVVFSLARIGVFVITGFVAISTFNPDLTGIQIRTEVLILVTILISITLVVIYYAEQVAYPDQAGVVSRLR